MGFLGCTKVYTGLHISALSEMLSRQLSQTKFITHVSGAFPINPGHKQHRSPTVCQQYVDILHFQQLQPIICLCGEEIQMLLDWTPLCPHPYISREVNMKKMLNRIAASIKLQASLTDALEYRCNLNQTAQVSPIVKTLTLQGRQLQDITHPDKIQTSP